MLIDYLNKIFPNANLINNLIDNSPLSDNYWLAGFIDADGGFKIRYTVGNKNEQTGRKIKQRISLSFKIEQQLYHKTTGVAFEDLMQKIAIFFTVNLTTVSHNDEIDYWCIEVASIMRIHLVIDYLNKYPLLTSKRNDFN
jgi:hypothetical protein